jgi:AAA15 family ATPase/GTPase
MRITIIVGLPGSGKTHLANSIQTTETILDDFFSLDEIWASVSKNQDLIICDPKLCFQKNRDKLTELFTDVPGVELKFMFFENDPIKAQRNVDHRALYGDVRKVSSFIKMATKVYNIPAGYEPMNIWQPSQ